MPDRDSLTPITALSSRLELERVARESKQTLKDIGKITGWVARVERRTEETHRVSVATAEAVNAHLKAEQERPRMSPAAIKAWGISIAAVLTVVVGALTQWRVGEAGAESRRGARVATQQEYDRRADADRQKLAEQTAELTARRTADEVRRAIREEQAEAERRASMRVASEKRTR